MRILLGVCGSIAAYKTFDLARSLVKKGHEVKVILTRGALEFVKPEVYRYLGVSDVYLDQDDFATQGPGVLHVELCKWAHRLVIAPCSANTLAELSQGGAKQLLTTVFLALPIEKPVLIFPAMNTQMLYHPFVQDNLKILKRFDLHPNCYIAPTDSGLLACGDTGEGKLMDVAVIEELILSLNPKLNADAPQVLITMGATKALLDPVRFLTNPASGLTAALIAKSFHQKGFKLVIVAGEDAYKNYSYLAHFPFVKMIKAVSTSDMHQAVIEHFPKSKIYLSPAAIGDVEFDYKDEKLKKDTLESSLLLKPSVDILKAVIELKKPDQVIVGFAAETDVSDEVLLKKLKSKPCDFLVGTKVHQGGLQTERQGFQNTKAHYRIFQKTDVIFEGELAKEELAEKLVGLTSL